MIKKYSKENQWPLYGWGVFFILSPFYIFGSGLPQPADWVMGLLFLYIIFNDIRVKNFYLKKLNRYHLDFVIYVILVNTLWGFLIDQSYEKRFPSYFNSIFYLYNFFALKVGLILYEKYGMKLLQYTAYGVGVSMILQMALSQYMEVSSRSALFFNNPNQLGYYALLSGSLLVYIVRVVKINTLFQLLAYFSFFYLTLLSASKAALGGAVILISLALMSQKLFNFKQMIILVVTVGVGYYFVTHNEFGSGLFDYALDRFSAIGETRDDSIEGRGYDRIFNDPEYMILGAGEGGVYRFDTALTSGEIHSSFGTIIFCYGILGTVLFFRFLFSIFKKSSLLELLYFVPVFTYSITHQGLRVTLFWVFLAIISIINQRKALLLYARARQLMMRKMINKEEGRITP